MATTNARAILESLKTRIEALTPSDRLGIDDQYRVTIGLRTAHTGARSTLLTCSPGRRKFEQRTCSDWELMISIEMFYTAQQGSYLRAVEDQDQIVSDLYEWTVTDGATLGVLKIEPDMASISEPVDGEILVQRFIRVEYQGD
jgi:hypothetical protein